MASSLVILCLLWMAQQTPSSAEKLSTVKGVVVNSVTNEPLSKATVTMMNNAARPDSPGVSHFTTSTNGQGEFEFTGVPAGTYVVNARRQGFVETFADRPSWQKLKVPEGDRVTGYKVAIVPQAVIAGRVTDADGEPLQNVMVSVIRKAAPGKRQRMAQQGIHTNDLGEFRISNLPPGRYYVLADNSGRIMTITTAGTSKDTSDRAAYPPVFFPGITSSSAATSIDLAAGAVRTGVDITMVKAVARRITGTASLGVSKQVWLDLRKVDANEGLDLPLPSITRYDGTFEFGAVIPGSYVLSALTDAGYIRMPLEVGDHDIDDLRVAVQPFLALQGRFRWEGGAPADAGELKATLQPLIPASDRTAQAVNGAFQFTHLLPGKMRVSVSKLSAQDYVKTILYGNAAIDDEVIDIVEGAELEVVLKRGAASVSGTVSTDQSDSAGPFTVLLIPKSRPNARGLYRSGTADPQGHFQLTGIAPGEYVLLAMEAVEQDAWFEPDFLARYGRDGESIKFEENARELRTLKLIR